MDVKKFVTKKEQKLSDAITDVYPYLSYGSVQKLIRQKDIKVDGKRVKQDFVLQKNATVEVFTTQDFTLKIEYEDDNILIVNKPKQIEVVNEKTAKNLNFSENSSSELNSNQNFNFSLEDYINKNHCAAWAVNRLDRNTGGLVVFAKNAQAKQSLEVAFKNHTLQKFYLSIVYGKVKNSDGDLIAYLKKDAAKSHVLISDTKKPGYTIIETKYKLLKTSGNFSLLEVELITGKTHQIRAHLAHIGHFVIGDNKYGEQSVNNSLKRRFQCLTAYKLIFHFSKDDFLYYLNDKTIELDREKEKFIKELNSYK